MGSGMKRALKITIGTSRKAMMENTAQIRPIRCLEPDRDDLIVEGTYELDTAWLEFAYKRSQINK